MYKIKAKQDCHFVLGGCGNSEKGPGFFKVKPIRLSQGDELNIQNYKEQDKTIIIQRINNDKIENDKNKDEDYILHTLFLCEGEHYEEYIDIIKLSTE